MIPFTVTFYYIKFLSTFYMVSKYTIEVSMDATRIERLQLDRAISSGSILPEPTLNRSTISALSKLFHLGALRWYTCV